MPQRVRFLVAIGVVVLAGLLTGCDKTIVGTARYAPNVTSTNLPLVKIDALPSLLPSAADAAATLKSPPLPLIGIYDTMPPSGAVVSDPSCVGAFGIDESVYRGSDYQGVFGQLSGDPAAPTGVRVDEGVVAFSSAEDAQKLVDTETQAWKACTGHPLTLTIDNQQVTWTASGPTVSYGVSVLMRAQQGDSFVCSHGLAARSNVAADVTVCSDDATTVKGQSAAIVNSILQRIPG